MSAVTHCTLIRLIYSSCHP